VPDDLQFVAASIGLLGTEPSYEMMMGCADPINPQRFFFGRLPGNAISLATPARPQIGMNELTIG
jgi:hypothetical protein